MLFPAADLASHLPSGLGPVQVVASTGSTNADLAAAAREGAAPGAVRVAFHQSAGRGRFTRRWEAPPGSSLAMSVLVRPVLPVTSWGWLSLLTGLAVADGIRAATGLAPDLKWPNDVLLDGRKVCGILAERATPDLVVIGMGVNLTLTADELPVPTATSLSLAGSTASALAVAAGVLGALAAHLAEQTDLDALKRAYDRRCATIGRRVRVVESEASSVEGLAMGVDAEGRLLVQVGDRVVPFAAGDVWHLR